MHLQLSLPLTAVLCVECLSEKNSAVGKKNEDTQTLQMLVNLDLLSDLHYVKQWVTV